MPEPPVPTAPVSARATGLPIGFVVVTLAAGLVAVSLHHFRIGGYLVGLALVAGALLRLVLPARWAGLLVVRGRALDVAALAVLGTAVVLLTRVVPAPAG